MLCRIVYHFTPGEIKIFCKPVCQPGLKLLPTCGSGVTRVPVTCMNISRSYFFPACIFPQSLMQFLRFSSHGVRAQLRHPRKSRVSFAKPFIGGAVRNIKRVSKEREAYEIFHSFIVGVWCADAKYVPARRRVGFVTVLQAQCPRLRFTAK